MKKLITIDDLSQEDIAEIFSLADNAHRLKLADAGVFACYSFEGNSIRTRATFIKALSDLGISWVELPNLLGTKEAPEHLAGYLDNWLDLYIIRAADHEKLSLFARYTSKPTINAMSSEAHPCEVLADAYSIQRRKGELKNLKCCIIGPPTNVLNSWQRLGQVLGLEIVHVLPEEYASKGVVSGLITTDKSVGLKEADIILTDAWPSGFQDKEYQLTLDDMKMAKADAWVIPCPPFNTKNEVHQEVIDSSYFAGYGQKAFLYQVQKAIIWLMLNRNKAG